MAFQLVIESGIDADFLRKPRLVCAVYVALRIFAVPVLGLVLRELRGRPNEVRVRARRWFGLRRGRLVRVGHSERDAFDDGHGTATKQRLSAEVGQRRRGPYRKNTAEAREI